MHEDVVYSAFGFCLGFGVSSVYYLRIVMSKLDILHQDNLQTARLLRDPQPDEENK